MLANVPHVAMALLFGQRKKYRGYPHSVSFTSHRVGLDRIKFMNKPTPV